jgi:SpoVK/Ycf46/Vps4 family AAA+-type ATPase
MKMGLTSPSKVELFYSVTPDVLKPHIEVQGKLNQLVKQEALARAERGDPLTFRFSVSGLVTIDVTAQGEGVPLPLDRTNLEFIVKRKESLNGSHAVVKQVEQFLLSEETYPSELWAKRYESLIGLTEIKKRVLTALRSLFSPEFVRQWSQQYNCEQQAFSLLKLRYPVFLFDGVPGVGKTELAHAIGDPLARVLGTPVVSYSIGLQLRGEGLVGQLSQNICKLLEFGHLRHAERGVPVLLVLNEGDALGQSRGGIPQHHEESVGVSTLLQQIDHMRHTPGVALIMTSNRHSALDTALASRLSAHRVSFPQPDYRLRFDLLARHVGNSLADCELRTLARETEGFSPRDIVELCQAAFLDAMGAECRVTLRHLLRAATLIGQSLNHEGSAPNSTANPAKADHPLPPTDYGVRGNGHTPHKSLA